MVPPDIKELKLKELKLKLNECSVYMVGVKLNDVLIWSYLFD